MNNIFNNQCVKNNNLNFLARIYTYTVPLLIAI